ncbi:hypothetical protein N7466_006529 [Penicillium verhagenii]|uniref:uncharacterized protein n=1 Tax=Penicillium verhagenii TaxID=1562060 RepID=UPI002545ABC4|nr:uncharacterized protein N7466_006529 [Penicillium verhagenii]KAJ5931036.1 hypothetical protein N7466_006529 [Penicillium verhagenii]
MNNRAASTNGPGPLAASAAAGTKATAPDDIASTSHEPWVTSYASFPLPDTPAVRHRTGCEVPPNTIGSSIMNPGPWARIIMSLPFRLAGKSSDPRTNALKLLHDKPLQREPVLRPVYRDWTSLHLIQRIAIVTSNIESALCQVVGDVAEEECSACASNSGPWSLCVRYVDANNTIPECANCRWNGKGRRCIFKKSPKPEISSSIFSVPDEHDMLGNPALGITSNLEERSPIENDTSSNEESSATQHWESLALISDSTNEFTEKIHEALKKWVGGRQAH